MDGLENNRPTEIHSVEVLVDLGFIKQLNGAQFWVPGIVDNFCFLVFLLARPSCD